MELIDKAAVVAEIERRRKEAESNCGGYKSYDEHRCDACTVGFYDEFLEIIDILEVKDPYEQCVQYPSIKDGIEAHAETYSFNIESELFQQLTKEQQALWRKEIEQACISGGDAGVTLARDQRYKENLEVKEVDLEKEIKDYFDKQPIMTKSKGIDYKLVPSPEVIAKHFFEFGLKTQKGEIYVVTRSEEHSDYVEAAFLSESKAKEYCKPYNQDENCYARDITKVKIQ